MLFEASSTVFFECPPDKDNINEYASMSTRLHGIRLHIEFKSDAHGEGMGCLAVATQIVANS